ATPFRAGFCKTGCCGPSAPDPTGCFFARQALKAASLLGPSRAAPSFADVFKMRLKRHVADSTDLHGPQAHLGAMLFHRPPDHVTHRRH
ncbi:MAG: hypothetical protein Q7K20_00535, partial [Polaromonas sp.]|nr:hypothetical protein [Polaromonas sp.]